MPERTVVIASKSGLHARPAMILTKAVAGLGVPVTISRAEGTPVDAGSILRVMALGVKQGDSIVVGSADPGALQQIADLLQTDLDAA